MRRAPPAPPARAFIVLSRREAAASAAAEARARAPPPALGRPRAATTQDHERELARAAYLLGTLADGPVRAGLLEALAGARARVAAAAPATLAARGALPLERKLAVLALAARAGYARDVDACVALCRATAGGTEPHGLLRLALAGAARDAARARARWDARAGERADERNDRIRHWRRVEEDRSERLSDDDSCDDEDDDECPRQWTRLHQAARAGLVDRVRVLLAAGALVNARAGVTGHDDPHAKAQAVYRRKGDPEPPRGPPPASAGRTPLGVAQTDAVKAVLRAAGGVEWHAVGGRACIECRHARARAARAARTSRRRRL